MQKHDKYYDHSKGYGEVVKITEEGFYVLYPSGVKFYKHKLNERRMSIIMLCITLFMLSVATYLLVR